MGLVRIQLAVGGRCGLARRRGVTRQRIGRPMALRQASAERDGS
jgi:hypothetical protein